MNPVQAIQRIKREGALNLAWLFLVLLGMSFLETTWPYQTWSWGFLMGAGLGGSAVFLVAMLYGLVRGDYMRA